MDSEFNYEKYFKERSPNRPYVWMAGTTQENEYFKVMGRLPYRTISEGAQRQLNMPNIATKKKSERQKVVNEYAAPDG